MKNVWMIIACLCFLMVSCVDDHEVGIDKNISKSDVYVVGYELSPNGQYLRGGYWKNGKQTVLSKAGLSPESIFLSGQDVYVAGSEVGPVGNNLLKYWKNGHAVSLTDGMTSDINGGYIVVNGKDVYVAASEWSGVGYAAKVWKNGISTSLTDGSVTAFVKGLVISGTDVYVVGHEESAAGGQTHFVAKYWKNGEVVQLAADPTVDSFGMDLKVFNGDVYACGYESINGKLVAVYWKNGVRTILTQSDFSFARSIFVSNSGVYTCGAELVGGNIYATYWVNGTSVHLSDGQKDASASSIVVSGTDVYVTGWDGDFNNHIAKVWKNAVAVNLTDGSTNAYAFAISISASVREEKEK